MAEIKLLSKDTIDKIAAGEVVEAPASIVKELVENSIDAGATLVRVDIKDGGTTFICIRDNGSGIPENSIRLAFTRHATSKLTDITDLDTISTLGFRGEALSSIAAVSQVELITCNSDENIGNKYCIDGGIEKSLEHIGSPVGTSFTVSNLFYNVPARRKFLKSAMTEASHVQDVVIRMALAHPEVGITFTVNGQVKHQTSGDNNLRNTIYSIFGKEITSNLISVDYNLNGMEITGYIGSPLIVRGNRSLELFSFNGRYFNDKLISKAIEDAYHPYMMQHKYPFTVLNIKMDPSYVDVNVHPRKLEVKFQKPSDVYQNVLDAVSYTLKNHETLPDALADTSLSAREEISHSFSNNNQIYDRNNYRKVKASEVSNSYQNEKASELSNSYQNEKVSELSNSYQNEKTSEVSINYQNDKHSEISNSFRDEKDSKISNSDSAVHDEEYFLARMRERVRKYHESMNESVDYNKVSSGNSILDNRVTGSDAYDSDKNNFKQPESGINNYEQRKSEINNSEQRELEINNYQQPESEINNYEQRLSESETYKSVVMDVSRRKDYRIIGQAFDTYYLIELDDQLLIVDQHAAHEKVLYEEFCNKLETEGILPQMILPPLIVTLSLAQQVTLKEHMEEFRHLGFDIESFGGDEFKISAVPSDFSDVLNAQFLIEMLDELSGEPNHNKMLQDMEHRLATMACKAAVKGNNKLSVREMEALLDKMLKADNPYNCPHGRPTMIRMTESELEKKFKRTL